jgi:four helix bundle protein
VSLSSSFHAGGSLAELDTQLLIAIELGFCTRLPAWVLLFLVDELQRMLNGLRQKLATRPSSLATHA